jgi:hypothetical protein
MRNLAQYPITQNEVIEVLVRAHHEMYDPQVMGDLTGYILSMLTMHVRDNPELIALRSQGRNRRRMESRHRFDDRSSGREVGCLEGLIAAAGSRNRRC